MARANLIDTHPDRDKIIGALLAQTPIADLAIRFGVSDSALYRYKYHRLGQQFSKGVQIAAARELSKQRDQEIRDLDSFISTAERVQNELQEIAKLAKEGDVDGETGRVRRDLRSAVAALNGVVATNRYHAELAGRLNSAPVTQNNTIVVMPTSLSQKASGPATELPSAPAPQLPAARPGVVIDAEFEPIDPAEKT